MRAARFFLIATVIGGSLIIPAPPAFAGGAHWAFEGHFQEIDPVLVAGDEIHAITSLWLPGVGTREDKGAFWGGPEHGPYYGYIVKRAGAGWGPYPPPLPDDAMYVGDVIFSETDDRQALDATLDFVMPDLEPGHYSLLHCNDPCTRQIGDTMTTPITVVQAQDQAFLTGTVNRLDREVMTLRGKTESQVAALRSTVRDLEARLNRMEDEISALEERADTAPVSRSTQDDSGVPWAGWLVPALVVLLAVLAWVRWRAFRPVSPPLPLTSRIP